jgi:hypothetical protein
MRSLLTHRFRRPTLVAWFCVSVLIGLGLGRIILIPSFVIWPALALVLVCVRSYRLGLLVAVIILGISAGGVRAGAVTQSVANYTSLYGRLVTVHGFAVDDAVYGKQTQLVFDIQHITDAQGHKLPGKIGVKGFGANAVFRNDSVTVTAKVNPGKGSYMGWMIPFGGHLTRELYRRCLSHSVHLDLACLSGREILCPPLQPQI